MLDPDVLAPERVRPLYRREYERLVELGVFEDEKLELLRGVLVRMSPQGAEHAEVIRRLNAWLTTRLAGRASVGVQLPLAVSDDSEPEPDIAVVAIGDYRRAHPTTALLLVEVAATRSAKDTILKAALYAEAAIPEYWVIDLVSSHLIVHRRPESGRYTELLRLGSSEEVAPAAFPDVTIAVAELLLV